MRCPPRNKWQINGQLKNNRFWMWWSFVGCFFLVRSSVSLCMFIFIFNLFFHIIFTAFWFDERATMSTKVLECDCECIFIAISLLLSRWIEAGFVFCWQQHSRLLILVATVRFIAIINDLDQGRTCNTEIQTGVPVRLRQNDNNFLCRRFLFIIFRICFCYFII